MQAVADSPDYVRLCGRLRDKFGDNGIVSIVIGQKQGTQLDIILWLMSCRVLKRDMEYAMMDALVRQCQKAGITKIKGYYYPTAKNKMVENFYGLQGFTKEKQDENGDTVWYYEIGQLYENKNKVIRVEE